MQGQRRKPEPLLKLAPNNFSAALFLGQSEFGAKEYDDAMKTVRALLYFQPENIDVLQLQGRTQMALQQTR